MRFAPRGADRELRLDGLTRHRKADQRDRQYP